MDVLTAASTATDITDILAFILLYILMITVAIFVIHMILAFVIYRDAERRGMNGAIWAILIIMLPFVFYFLGIILYLIALLVVIIIYAIARSNTDGFRRCAEYAGGKCKRYK